MHIIRIKRARRVSASLNTVNARPLVSHVHFRPVPVSGPHGFWRTCSVIPSQNPSDPPYVVDRWFFVFVFVFVFVLVFCFVLFFCFFVLFCFVLFCFVLFCLFVCLFCFVLFLFFVFSFAGDLGQLGEKIPRVIGNGSSTNFIAILKKSY